LMCSVNLQHDCVKSQCSRRLHAVETHQERSGTSRTHNVINHVCSKHFVLNTYSLHNYQFIARLIPSHLQRSLPYVADPDAVRRQAVAQMK
ncbi:hypothetical protein OF83DRAFT_1036908, partial [Amylostereum chailletii]